MLGYATVGTDDIEQAGRFYDPLFALLGARRLHSFDRGIFYGVDSWDVAVVRPFDGQDAAPGNGTMIALKAPSRSVVDQVHAQALATGGLDEGSPGIRGREEGGFYGAYFRAPGGNKFCVFHISRA